MRPIIALGMTCGLLVSATVADAQSGLYWRLSPKKCMASPVTTCTFVGAQSELLIDVGFTNSEQSGLALPPLDTTARVELKQGERLLQLDAQWDRQGQRTSSVGVEELIDPAAQPLFLPAGTGAILTLKLVVLGPALQPGTYTLTVDLNAVTAQITTEDGSAWRRPGRKESWTIAIKPLDTPEAHARYNMLEGLALTRRGDCADALPYLQRWKALKPDDPSASTELGRCLLRLNRWSDAEAALSSALAHAMRSRRMEEAERVATMIAFANERMGRRAAAEAVLRLAGLSEDRIREVIQRIRRPQ